MLWVRVPPRANNEETMSNIILIGFMGSGKSEVGIKLAKELKMNFIDTDDLIEKAEGKSISSIFKDHGEEHFRNVETNILDTLSDYDNFVISTGGGIVLRKENVNKLKKLGPLVLLTAKTDVIIQRLKGVKNRPLLDVPDPKKKINEILEYRNPIYEGVADYKVDTSDANIDGATKKIIKHVKR